MTFTSVIRIISVSIRRTKDARFSAKMLLSPRFTPKITIRDATVEIKALCASLLSVLPCLDPLSPYETSLHIGERERKKEGIPPTIL